MCDSHGCSPLSWTEDRISELGSTVQKMQEVVDDHRVVLEALLGVLYNKTVPARESLETFSEMKINVRWREFNKETRAVQTGDLNYEVIFTPSGHTSPVEDTGRLIQVGRTLDPRPDEFVPHFT